MTMIGNTKSDPAIKIGIVTVSDRASAGIYADLGGPAIAELLKEMLTVPWEACQKVIPDDVPIIRQTLSDLADCERCCLIVTTGGTGPAPRDVTPESTEAICHKMLPGFGEMMRAVSLQKVPTAILSRQTAGIRGSSLIINLPGKPSAIRDYLMAVMPAVPYCIDLIEGGFIDSDPAQCKAFRPAHALRPGKS